MVDLALLQSLSYVAAAIGVCVAAFNYISMIRNTEKISRRDMVFQRLNVNMYQHYKILYDVLNIRDWNTIEEFRSKYSLTANPEAFSKIVYVINHYNCLGILLRDGIVDADEVFQLNPPNAAHAIYTMYEPWIVTQRMSLDGKPTYPDNYKGFEYLYHEIVKRYPGMVPLREWGTRSDDFRVKWGRTWDEFFKGNPQLLENPLPRVKEV